MENFKVLTIVSHKLEEFMKFLNIQDEDLVPSPQEMEFQGKNDNWIKFFRKSENFIDIETESQKNILLYHQFNNPNFQNWKDRSLIFDVGTHGNNKTEEGSDRFYYEKLLNANNKNNFNWNIFDEVWDYFWNKAKKQSNEKKKTDFLFSIYDGCIINEDLEEKLDEDLLERIGKNEAYQFFKSGDISYDKNNVEHVQKLTQLRDLILES